MSSFPIETSPRIKRIARPFQEFAAAEAAGGIVLLACTAIALIWANSPWSPSYFDLWGTKLTIGAGDFALSKPLLLWINDGLMAIFFFVIGLEIKRELLVGELASPRKAALPIAAALGGMVVPALVYFAFTAGSEEVRGWAVPMATDIAFALGILALLGDRVPLSLKVFLTAAAIVDDLGAVLVIAVFYTAKISMTALTAAAAILLVLAVANFLGVRRTVVYVVLGLALWLAILKSGVHATIAGVLLALAIPARLRMQPAHFVETVTAALVSYEGSVSDPNPESESRRQGALHVIEEACHLVETPLSRMEHALHGWVAFLIMPIFALANAGVDLRTGLGAALGSSVGLGIALGLLLGKPIGIGLFAWLAARTGIGDLPLGVTWPMIIGAGLIAGIGFTMALFIAGLAFGTGPLLTTAKAGIMMGSLVAGILGYSMLRWATARN